MISKQSLRALARARIADMAPSRRAELGERIAEGVWHLPEAESARTLLLYAATATEVPTAGIAAEARRRGIEVVYPRCLPALGEMTLHKVASEDELIAGGRFGIREPAPDCRPTDLDEIDLALLPGLAWDRHGNRLGRGAGYYDRLLASAAWRGSACGLFFAAQEFPTLPADSWDRPLDAVVTEDEILTFNPPSSPT